MSTNDENKGSDYGGPHISKESEWAGPRVRYDGNFSPQRLLEVVCGAMVGTFVTIAAGFISLKPVLDQRLGQLERANAAATEEQAAIFSLIRSQATEFSRQTASLDRDRGELASLRSQLEKFEAAITSQQLDMAEKQRRELSSLIDGLRSQIAESQRPNDTNGTQRDLSGQLEVLSSRLGTVEQQLNDLRSTLLQVRDGIQNRQRR